MKKEKKKKNTILKMCSYNILLSYFRGSKLFSDFLEN